MKRPHQKEHKTTPKPAFIKKNSEPRLVLLRAARLEPSCALARSALAGLRLKPFGSFACRVEAVGCSGSPEAFRPRSAETRRHSRTSTLNARSFSSPKPTPHSQSKSTKRGARLDPTLPPFESFCRELSQFVFRRQGFCYGVIWVAERCGS